VVRPVQRYAQKEDFGRLKARLGELRRAGHTAAAIAARLNEEGFTPPKRRGPFTRWAVRQLQCRCGLPDARSYAGPLGRDEWWLPDLARELGVSAGKLRQLAAAGQRVRTSSPGVRGARRGPVSTSPWRRSAHGGGPGLPPNVVRSSSGR
jgi:hypothetical protein